MTYNIHDCIDAKKLIISQVDKYPSPDFLTTESFEKVCNLRDYIATCSVNRQKCITIILSQSHALTNCLMQRCSIVLLSSLPIEGGLQINVQNM